MAEHEEITLTVPNGNYLLQGIQLRNRTLVPKWLGDLILWVFFHRLDTQNTITISGFANWGRGDVKRLSEEN
jgi:hypothetical protein